MANLELILLRILAAIVAMVVAFFGGAYFGYEYEKRAADAAALAAADKAIDEHNQTVTAAANAYFKAGVQDAQANARAKQIDLEGQLDAARKAKPECAWDDESFGLLLKSIDAANDQGSATTAVPEGVRGNAEAEGSNGFIHSAMDIFDRGDRWKLPAVAQPVRGSEQPGSNGQ
jgi:hypothetical protein